MQPLFMYERALEGLSMQRTNCLLLCGILFPFSQEI